MRLLCPRTIFWSVLGAALAGYGAFASQFVIAQRPNPPAVVTPQSQAAQSQMPQLQAVEFATPASQGAASLPLRPSLYRISGTVTDAVTRSPVANATLTAEPVTTVRQNGGASRRSLQNAANSTATDSEGHFDLSVPSAGGWSLTVECRGYRRQRLDQHDGYSTAVVLTEAVPQFNVSFVLTPASVIEGFVLDEAGEAVRGANVALLYLPPPTPASTSRRPLSRGQQMTDDRGFYKFTALGPGSYQVRVTAHPWYATTAATQYRISLNERAESSKTAGERPAADPLDVVYPVVWFPGASDPSGAVPIILRGGDTQEANFRLLPTPSSHLRVAGSHGSGADSYTPDGHQQSQPPLPNTYLTLISPDGTEDAQQTQARFDDHGNADLGGLAPGTYLVHQDTASTGISSLSTIQVGAGPPRTIDLSEGVRAATVTVLIDAAADLDDLQVTFQDIETGHAFYAQRPPGSGEVRTHHRGQSPADPPPDPNRQRPDRTVSLPAGKYEVVLSGIGDLHLASIEATGATATGRIVSIGTGAPKLFLHTAKGLGTVTGVVKLNGQPLPGAMVMLIPATLGNPSGLDVPSRDQSNTDGSFEMSDLLPGGYILVAIDHGWEVNWSDPSTLRRYLLHGIPLDIKPGSDLKQAVEAQSP